MFLLVVSLQQLNNNLFGLLLWFQGMFASVNFIEIIFLNVFYLKIY
jgi:hypothetical protein